MRCDFWANLALCLVLSALVVFALGHAGSALTERGLFVGKSEPAPAVAEAVGRMQMEVVAMESAAGGEVRAGFVLYNGGDQPVRDLEVRCEFFDAQQDYVGRQRWVLRQVVAAGAVEFSETVGHFFVPRRAEGVQCELVGLKIARPGPLKGPGAGGAGPEGH